jgi:hypothetical protein
MRAEPPAQPAAAAAAQPPPQPAATAAQAHMLAGGASEDARASGACFAFQKGECTRGDACRFAHDQGGGGGEAGPGRKRQKVAKPRGGLKHLCHEFEQRGGCAHGDACKFAHGQAELKPSFRSPALSAARLLLRQRVAERRCGGPAAPPHPPDYVERDCTEMFWVSPRDPVGSPLFQSPEARRAAGAEAPVAEADRQTCTDQDQYVNMHKNELCILGVAHSHSMFAAGRTVRAVRYEVDCSAISGKKKKGAPKLEQCAALSTHLIPSPPIFSPYLTSSRLTSSHLLSSSSGAPCSPS